MARELTTREFRLAYSHRSPVETNRQIEATTHKNVTSTEKAEQFRQWVAQFPKR